MAYGTNVIVTYGMRSLSYGIISGGPCDLGDMDTINVGQGLVPCRIVFFPEAFYLSAQCA